jgi:hypothetical protein
VAPLAALTKLRHLDLTNVAADIAALSHLPRCHIVTAPIVPRRRRAVIDARSTPAVRPDQR